MCTSKYVKYNQIKMVQFLTTCDYIIHIIKCAFLPSILVRGTMCSDVIGLADHIAFIQRERVDAILGQFCSTGNTVYALLIQV